MLDTLAAGKPLPPELKGSIKLSGAAPLDFTGAAMDMAGGRGPIAIGMALDREGLSDAQLAAIYPALAQFMADLAEFRQAGTAARGTATPPANPNATAPASTQKVVTQQDVQAANQKLHDSAVRLKTVIKQNSNPKQAAELFDALEQMQAQKLVCESISVFWGERVPSATGLHSNPCLTDIRAQSHFQEARVCWHKPVALRPAFPQQGAAHCPASSPAPPWSTSSPHPPAPRWHPPQSHAATNTASCPGPPHFCVFRSED